MNVNIEDANSNMDDLCSFTDSIDKKLCQLFSWFGLKTQNDINFGLAKTSVKP